MGAELDAGERLERDRGGLSDLDLRDVGMLNATVIVIEPVLTISTRPELLDEEEELLDPPRLPAVEAAPDPEPELALEFELDVELDADPAETASPGETCATLTTVPVAGA
jgi:hypothetical protein